jgi:hypothetical protein
MTDYDTDVVLPDSYYGISFRRAQVSRADDSAQRGEYTVSEQHHEAEVMHHHMRIHIDQKHYESPNPTTGEALYALGNVPAGLELYREVSGDREDKPILNGPETVHLKEDEHFHSGQAQIKEFKIIVNGREKVVATERLSFNEVVSLGISVQPTGTNILFTITYENGPHANPEGTLMQGATVKIKNGMRFDVSATNQS